MRAGGLSEIVEQRSIVVCCGSGGVGKTTTAAALAVEGARSGRRTCVVTIDPARRLADALGAGALGNVPTRVQGDWPGELWAVMLDTESTFDALVRRYAATPEQAEEILGNRLYRNVAAALSGTQEYMAMEKLYELRHAERPPGLRAEDGDSRPFDLIVVDTPPTRNALDFIEAPGRLTRLLDNRVFRFLVMPTRVSIRAVSAATQGFLRAVSRVVGAEVVADVVTFFKAFEGMEEGFRERAHQVRRVLVSPSTGFVLVTTAQRDAVEEAAFFAEKLGEAGIEVAAVVVNRLHPRLGDGSPGESAGAARERARALAGTSLAPLYENLADLRQVAEREEAHLERLFAQVAPAPLVRVPFLATDVHDLEGVGRMGRLLVRSPGSAPLAG